MPPIKSHSTAVDTKASWNGPSAMREAPQEAGILRYMTAWYAGKNPDSKGSYKFPHHPPRMNAPANLRGVNNALARLPQATIPDADRAGVEAHLRKHRKDAGLSEALSTEEILECVSLMADEGLLSEEARKVYQDDLIEAEMNLMVNSYGQPLTFEALDAEKDTRQKMVNLDRLQDDLWRLFFNIRREPMNAGDRLMLIRELFDGFLMRAEMLLSEEEVQESNQIKESFTITPEVLDDLVAEGLGTASVRSPLRVKMALIEPGWGNKKMNRYYPPEVVRRDAHVFEGVKMYKNGHNLSERTEADEVAVVDKIIGFSQTGAPLAEVTIFDPDTAEKTRNRATAEKLNTLEASILGTGAMQEGERDGRKGYIVNQIKKGISFDLVPKAGAGGRAIELLSESGENEDGDQVTQETNTTEEPKSVVEETTENPAQESDQALSEGQTAEVTESGTDDEKIVLLSEVQVTELLSENQTFDNLPSLAQDAIKNGVYLTEDDLKKAVDSHVKLIKEMTGAGMAPNLGETKPEKEETKPLSEAEVQEEYDNIFSQNGG